MTVIDPIKAESSLIAVTVGDTGFTPAIKDAVRRERLFRRISELTSDPVAATEAGHPFYGNQWTQLKHEEGSDYNYPAGTKVVRLEHLGWSKKGVRIYGFRKTREQMEKYASHETVPLDGTIHRTQTVVPLEGLHAHNEGRGYDKGVPELVRDHLGGLHVLSGHTRLSVKKLNGETHAKVHVYNIDEKGNLVKPSKPIKASEPQSPHETARRIAARIYKAAMESWVAHYHADLLAALTANPNMDYDGVIGPELILAWRQLMGQAAIKARQATFGVLKPASSPNRVPPQALNAFANARESALERFPGDFGDKVAASLSRGLKTDSRTGLARRLEEAINSTADVKVPLASETEAQIAYGVSQDQALRLAGYTKKRWQTVNDERVRESHTLCEEQGAIPLGSPFKNGLMHPGDLNAPPEETINCRCNLIGVLR